MLSDSFWFLGSVMVLPAALFDCATVADGDVDDGFYAFSTGGMACEEFEAAGLDCY